MDEFRALLVDDSKVNQHAATLLLNGLNVQVDSVDDGSEAIAAFEKHSYQIIFWIVCSLTQTFMKLIWQSGKFKQALA